MKKILAVLIVLILALSAVSCGKAPERSEQEKTQDPMQTPPQETEGSAASDYKKVYLDFLKDKKESHRLFALVFIDNDDIPELYLCGGCEAEGDMICSIKNDRIIYQRLERTLGGKYTEKSGKVINQNGTYGQYHTNAYKLDEEGFTNTFNASSAEKSEHIGNNEYIFHYEYFIGDTPVSEADYDNAINAVFDFSKAVRLNENAVSYEEIIRQLQSGEEVGQ